VDAIKCATLTDRLASSHASSTPATRSCSTASSQAAGTVISGMSATSLRAIEALGRTITPA